MMMTVSKEQVLLLLLLLQINMYDDDSYENEFLRQERFGQQVRT